MSKENGKKRKILIPPLSHKVKNKIMNIKYWHKYGIYLIFIIILFGIILDTQLLIAVATILTLTVPCGIRFINKSPILWVFRQIIFILITFMLII